MLSEWWSDIRYRLRALVDRGAVERELADELRFHIEREAEKLRGGGLSNDEAMRRARIAFGGVDRAAEESRDARGTVLLETTLQDIRYAARGLRAKPVFTLGVVLALGLGIGANAAMFGIVDRLLFRPPAFLRDPNTVHRIFEVQTTERGDRFVDGLQVPRYLDFLKSTNAFSTIAGFSTLTAPTGDGESSRDVRVTAASASYFDLFDARPVIGRFYGPADDQMPTGSPVVVLGYEYWQSELGGRTEVLGKTIRVGRTLCTIIGVAPEGFNGTSDQGVPAMYVPLSTYAWNLRGSDIRPGYDYRRAYSWHWLELVARRKPGVSIDQANADLTAATRRSRQAEPGNRNDTLFAKRPIRAALEPLQTGRGPTAGAEAKIVVWVSGVALIVLLIACANVANLLLARAVTRRREIALRLALGVSRGRLLRQLLTESLLLAALGGVAGLAAAQWGGAVLRALFLSKEAGASVVTDIRTLVVAIGATFAAALLTGLAPVFQTLRYDVSQTLNAAGRDAGSRSSRLRTGLLLFQATLSVVLLVGAGLFVRSLDHVRAMKLGFDVDPLLVVSDNMRGVKLSDAERIALERRLSDEARAIPGVVAATPSPSIPFWGFEGRAVIVDGVTVDTLVDLFLQAGNPDYFRTMGTRILRGRAFDDRDGPTAPRVVVVSDGMARALWPNQDPLGKCMRLGADTTPCLTVIGVAEEMHINTLDVARAKKPEYTYTVPIAQYADGPTGELFVRVAGDASASADAVRRRLQRLMPGASYVTTRPFREIVDPKMQSWKLGATMFVAFASLALVLAAIGLYSVIAYGVAQRRQEIGVRIALGATSGNVVRLVVRGGLRLVIGGVVFGSAIALAAGRWVDVLLFQESSRDPVVYGVVAVVLVSVALVATAIPAAEAASVDPNVALRVE